MWVRSFVSLVSFVALTVTPAISCAGGLSGSTIVYFEVPFRYGSEDIEWQLGIGRESLLLDVQQSIILRVRAL